MPVLSTPGTGPAPPPSAPPWAAKTILWTSAAGTIINLSDRDGGYACGQGRAGFGPVDRQLTADTMWDGSTIVRAHRPTPRVMTVPLMIEGTDDLDYRAKLGALQASFRHPVDQASGLPVPGLITAFQADGSARQITAFYQSGGAGSEDELDDVAWGRGFLPNLQFYAPVDTWEGDLIAAQWVPPGSGVGVPPMPPILLAASVLGANQVTNPGDSDAYPVWTITGPGTPSIINSDTGQSFVFTTAIGAGVTVTVDARPPALAPATGLTAMDNLGNDWWPHLQDYPDFWVLPPGTSNLDLAMTGTSAASLITLAAASRWLGGW